MKPSILAAAITIIVLPTITEAARAEKAPAAQTSAEASSMPDPSDVLFDKPQMKNVEPGSTIRYTYLRRSGITRGPYGPPLDDEIKLKIEPGKSPESRDIQVQMFSGANRAPAGPFMDMAGNPILPLFLENHLKGLAALLEANPRYLKNAIRKGLRDKATITPAKVDYQGRQVDGWRIVTKPFEGDAQTEKMRGFEGLTYTFITSPEIPGEIVSIEAQARKPDGGELLEEKVNYDQSAG